MNNAHLHHMLLASYGYRANAVNFDSINTWLARAANLTGVVDGKELLISFWLKCVTGDAADMTIAADGNLGTGTFHVARTSANKIQIAGYDAAGNLDLNLQSTTSVVVATGLVHVLSSVNLATGLGLLYLNDVDDTNAVALVNDTIDWAGSGDFGIGAEPDGGAKLSADIADLYINFATSLDLSVVANRRKFISAAGKPVFLGADGSLPTGSAPAVFLSGPTATWHTNRGAGGGFTENGALTDGAVVPT
jgi:hypothetical protein